MMASGKCALTLKEGSFVESHIIPRALTQTTNEGTGFVQVGGDAKGKNAGAVGTTINFAPQKEKKSFPI